MSIPFNALSACAEIQESGAIATRMCVESRGLASSLVSVEDRESDDFYALRDMERV